MAYATAADGAQIYYKDWGKGRPAVLMHGWPLTGDTFDEMGIALSENGYRCIIIDRRGFGRSDKTWQGNDYDSYADDVAAILDDAGIDEPAALIGFSMGGGEVARFQSRHKGRTSAAILISSVVPHVAKSDENPNGVPQDTLQDITQALKSDHQGFFPGFFEEFFGVDENKDAVSDGVQRGAFQQTMQASIHNILASADAWATTNFLPDLKNFDRPTLVIHGTKDKTVPIDATARVVADKVKQAKLIEYDGSPHAVFATDKERLIDDVKNFLDDALGEHSAIPLHSAETA
ncbi:alpha/beta fold hydrolase [Sphingomicrobium flavum]|uniref:alpha/beta fold hydrolase n=1 Tax=Sphingomicrobium flavum TaxID=1229164 RepID=UPI0021AE2B6C|nr:alpha/beta hydrolase [Sphingomicrobium flavum]